MNQKQAYVKNSSENYFSSLFIVSPKKCDSMNVKIQTVRFNADEKLVAYITQKLEKLKIFHDRIVEVDVFLKLDNVIHTIKDKIAFFR